MHKMVSCLLSAILALSAVLQVSASEIVDSENWAQANRTYDREVKIFEILQTEWNVENWPMSTNETDSSDANSSHCNWNGVVCDELGRAIRLMLNSKKIDGTIPAVIGELQSLEQLYLYGNMLSGTIPAQLSDLSRLTHLSIGDNRLEGTIPFELGSLSSLQYFFTFGNRLEGTIPKSLGSLRNLLHLGLWNNQISGSIPQEIGQLEKLQYLGLNGNQLSGSLPTTIFYSMTQLSYLYLSGNPQLEGGLPDMENLVNLEGLYLSNTNISGSLPCKLVHLSKLKAVEASDTLISGCLTLECLLAAPECGADSTWIEPRTSSEMGVEL